MSRKVYSAITSGYRVREDAEDPMLLRHAATVEWYSRLQDSPENHIPTGVMLSIRGIPHRYALVRDDVARRESDDEGMPAPAAGYSWTRKDDVGGAD